MKTLYQFSFSKTFFSHLIKAIFYSYHYDKGVVIKKILTNPELIIDVGTHSGQVSKMLSRLYNNKVKIIAIEPGLYARTILRISIIINRLKNIFVLPVAVSDKPGFSFLNIPEKRKNSLGFGLSHMSSNHNDFSERKFKTHYDYVPVTTIDQIVDDLNLEKVDFIKMDIEGFEYKALLGATKTLKKYKPILYMELHEKFLQRNKNSTKDVYSFLRKLNYKSFFISGTGLIEYKDSRESDEIFFINKK
tara:strand:+ start:6629 stop:7369 length:741 start_codon:yes stop_codon:yes gene_type:complete